VLAVPRSIAISLEEIEKNFENILVMFELI